MPELPEATWQERAASVPEPPQVPRWVVPGLTGLVGVGCALAGLSRGLSGFLAGLVALLVVLMFTSSSALPLRISQDLGDGRTAGLGVLLLNYLARLALTLFTLTVAVVAGVDQKVLGISVIVCALVRINVQVALIGRRRST